MSKLCLFPPSRRNFKTFKNLKVYLLIENISYFLKKKKHKIMYLFAHYSNLKTKYEDQ